MRDGARHGARGVVDGRGGGLGRGPVRVPGGRRPPAAGPPFAAPAGRTRRPERGRRPGGVRLARGVGGAAAEPCGAVRAACGDVHPRGHLRRGGGAAGPSGRAGRHPCVADARLPVPGRQRLGVRGRLAVGGARAVRRPRGTEALCRHGARAGARGGPGRRPQPPGPVREPPARLRTVLHRHPPHPVGRGGQPGRAGLRRGAGVPAGQRPGLAARLPPGRAAARRGARARRHPGAHLPGGAVGGGRRAVRRGGQAARADRRVRPLRSAHDDPASGRAASGCTPSGTTTSTTPCTPRSPASPRATTPTSPAPRSPPSPRR